MGKIEVLCKVRFCELDGKEVNSALNILTVKSHWDRNDWIVLKFGEHEITVVGLDLAKAIVNAMNAGI